MRSALDDADPLYDALMEAGLTGVIPVSGETMSPILRHGDGVVVTPSPGLPVPGQIVAVHLRNSLQFRRLVHIEMERGRRRYILQGDACDHPDLSVTREQLHGRAVMLVRQGIRHPIADDPGTRRRALHRLARRSARRRDSGAGR